MYFTRFMQFLEGAGVFDVLFALTGQKRHDESGYAGFM